MKISIIGAGNVGGLTAMRLAENSIGDIVLIDIAKGLAEGKILDLEDTCACLKLSSNIKGSDNINEIQDSDIIIVTAGFARKPGMSRENLFKKNALILKDICKKIQELAPKSIIIIVTNPLDLMTQFALKNIGFSAKKIFGMGVSLDAARFSNLISRELQIPPVNIETCVIGSHGEGMFPLPRFTKIKGSCLDKIINNNRIEALITRTIDRGKEIVSLIGSGSAYFAPSAAIAEIVKAIVNDEKRVLGVSVYLNGEYKIQDICIGLPCVIGRNGIEEIVELALNDLENNTLQLSALRLKQQYQKLWPTITI